MEWLFEKYGEEVPGLAIIGTVLLFVGRHAFALGERETPYWVYVPAYLLAFSVYRLGSLLDRPIYDLLAKRQCTEWSAVRLSSSARKALELFLDTKKGEEPLADASGSIDALREAATKRIVPGAVSYADEKQKGTFGTPDEPAKIRKKKGLYKRCVHKLFYTHHWPAIQRWLVASKAARTLFVLYVAVIVLAPASQRWGLMQEVRTNLGLDEKLRPSVYLVAASLGLVLLGFYVVAMFIQHTAVYSAIVRFARRQPPDDSLWFLARTHDDEPKPLAALAETTTSRAAVLGGGAGDEK